MPKSIRIFLSSSWLVFLLTSCSFYTFKEGLKTEHKTYDISYFSQENKAYIFNADLTAFKNHISGIFVIKKIKNNNYRMALVSDLGNTLLDFELKNDTVKVHYVMDDLNRKIIVNKLKKYFQLLVNPTYDIHRYKQAEKAKIYLSNLQGKRVFLRVDQEGYLQELRQASFWKNKADIQFYHAENQLDSIQFKSYEWPIEMKFRKQK